MSNSSAAHGTDDRKELDLARIRAELVDSGLYAKVDHTAQTGSTNADLMKANYVVDKQVLLADEQLAAKGRLGRSWSAPAKAQVIMSVALLPMSLEHLGTLPLAAGLAVTDVVDKASLKWPNDVQIDGQKLCGILAEAGPISTHFGNLAEGEPVARVVLGMGINVSLTKEERPVETATSLLIEGLDTDRTELTIGLMKALNNRLEQWKNQDPTMMKDYRQVCSTIGMDVRLEAPGGDIYGVVEGVADDGRINVGGEYYSAGDVIHLRPAKAN